MRTQKGHPEYGVLVCLLSVAVSSGNMNTTDIKL